MHVSKKKILDMSAADSVVGLYVTSDKPTQCDNCLVGKSARQPFLKSLPKSKQKVPDKNTRGSYTEKTEETSAEGMQETSVDYPKTICTRIDSCRLDGTYRCAELERK